jgi:integrase
LRPGSVSAVNPASEKQAARAAAGTTVGALVRQYLETKARDWRPNSLREHRRYLLVYARPLHTTPINTVSQHSIAVLPDSVAKKAGDVTSNRLRSSLEAFVGWAIRQGVRLPEGNVVSYTGKRKETSRDRVLSDGDLKAIWTACNDGTDYGACVRLLLLTGQRKEEIGALRFAELRDGHIELPGSRTKNKRPHIVPLSAPAAAILAPFRMVGRTYVFGRNDTAGFRGWAASKRRLDRRLSKNCISPWVLHDLRRTAATRMAELGVQPHIVEAVLNHVSGAKAGVAGIYNRAAYDKEKRAALDLWAEHVLAVAEGRTTTVVPMKRGA